MQIILLVHVLKLVQELHNMLTLLHVLCHLLLQYQLGKQLLLLRVHFVLAVLCLVYWLLR